LAELACVLSGERVVALAASLRLALRDTERAMSKKNVEIVKRLADAFNRRDLDAYDGLCTPDFEWFPAFPGMVEGAGYRGREGIEAFLEMLSETWEEFRMRVDEFRDLGDRVLWLGRMEGQGRGSGVPVDAPIGVICDVRGGKVWRSRAYLDHGEALRAAGLSE
jgi:ketosteroid isomerase-like protein